MFAVEVGLLHADAAATSVYPCITAIASLFVIVFILTRERS